MRVHPVSGIVCFLLLPSIALFSQQTPDDAISRSEPECADLLREASVRIPDYDRKGQLEDAWELMQSWQENCAGPAELQTYTRAILQLKRERRIDPGSELIFVDRLLDAPLDVFSAARRNTHFTGPDEVIRTPEERRLYEYLALEAERLLPAQPAGSMERFTCLVLSGRRHEAMEEIRKEPLASSLFAHRVKERRRALFQTNAMHFQLHGGAWSGLGHASAAGQMAVLGLSTGGSFRNGDLMDITFSGWMGGAPVDSVRIAFLDSTWVTDFVSGISAALEYDKVVWSSDSRRLRLGLRGGVGYSHLNLVPERFRGDEANQNNNQNDTNRKFRKYVSSFTASVGPSLSYFLTPGVYVGVQGRFIFSSYRNYGGTAIDGPAWTGTLCFGFLLGDDRRSEAQKLGLKL